MITLVSGDTIISVAPERGGGLLCFEWRGVPVFLGARVDDPTPQGLASFPLVPWSNRIANGRFGDVVLPPNMPNLDQPHAVHGHGWLLSWDVVEALSDRVTLRYRHAADDWPWAYEAWQQLVACADGYVHRLALTNLDSRPMPAGLGLHPYFPRPGARICTAFNGYWQTTPDGLPTQWVADGADSSDLLSGTTVDTHFTGRQGPLLIEWPTHRLTIAAPDDLNCTVIYAPEGGDFFCVEPVSHETDAINRGGMRRLAPGERWASEIVFRLAAR